MQVKHNSGDKIFPAMNLTNDIYEVDEITENLNTSVEGIDTIDEDIIQEDLVLPSVESAISSEDTQPNIYYETTIDQIQSINTNNSSESIDSNNSGGGNADNFNLYYDPEKNNTDAKYVLNISSKLIHSPDCNDVRKIKPDNYQTYNEDLTPLFASGYRYCKHCLDKK